MGVLSPAPLERALGVDAVQVSGSGLVGASVPACA